MVDYFIFGRFPGGFQHLKNQAPGSLNSSFCGNMVKYDLPRDTSSDTTDYSELPEKLFYLNANVITDQGKVERYGIAGRTYPHTYVTSPMSGERETSFSFQYLMTGKDRETLLSQPDKIFLLKEGAKRVDDLYLGDSAAQDQKFPFDYDMSVTDIFADGAEQENTEALLTCFGLTGDKLSQLLATLFIVKRKVFIALPENTREATQKAKSLLAALLKCLPASLVETTGFLTYAHSVKKDYIPAEARIVFYEESEENKRAASDGAFAATGFMLSKEYASGFFIPEGLDPIVAAVRTYLLGGEMSPQLKAFYELLDEVRFFQTNASILPGDYVAAWNYARTRTEIAAGEIPTDDEEKVWDSIHGLQKHPEIWDKEKMQEELTTFLRSYISSETVTERTYEELFGAYRDFSGIRDDISGFLARTVSDKKVLRKMTTFLDKDPVLQKEVTDLIYQDKSKEDFVAEYEAEELGDSVTALFASEDPVDPGNGVNVILGRLSGILEKRQVIAVHPAVVKTVTDALNKLFLQDQARDLETDRQAWIAFAAGQAKAFLPDKTYQKVCTGVFGQYLKRFAPQMELTYHKPEELEQWPRILYMAGSGNEKTMSRLHRLLTEKSKKELYISSVSKAVAEGEDIRKLTRFLKDYENEPAIRALKSEEDLCRKAVGAMARKGFDYDKAKVKSADKGADFDELNITLCETFPEYADYIYYAVMKASLGGLPSLYQIAHRLQADGVDPRTIRAGMQEAVRRYYSNNRPGWSEKRQIKENAKFLEKLGLRPDQLIG